MIAPPNTLDEALAGEEFSAGQDLIPLPGVCVTSVQGLH